MTAHGVFSTGGGTGPKKGQRNTSSSAPELAKGAVASFLLSAVLTRL